MDNKFKIDCLMAYMEACNTDTIGTYKVWYKPENSLENAKCIEIRATTRHQAIKIVETLNRGMRMDIWIYG